MKKNNNGTALMTNSWSSNCQNAVIGFCFFLLVGISSYAQNGYIYIHSKTLDESSSPDITFSVSGGPTLVPNFSLNDNPAQVSLSDIGSSQNGRLWAVGKDDMILYYRNLGSVNWVSTGVTNVTRVDGGAGGTAYYIAGGTVFSHNGTSSTALSGFTDATDIGCGWNVNSLYVIRGGDVYKYSGSGTTWSLFYDVAPDYRNIDVSPVDGYVYVTSASTTTVESYRISPAGVAATMGKPSEILSGLALFDIAVDALNNVFITGGTNRFVHKWAGGTSWGSRELTTTQVNRITGGIAGQMWLTMRLSWDNAGYPFNNIYSRSLDGTNEWWIDDERVRTSVANGNSNMISVAPGTYTITETVPGGWDLQKITVYDPGSNSSSDVNAHTATITVAAGEVVHVIFQSGLVTPFAMTNNCGIEYTENFGTGTPGSFGPPFLGQTSYHYMNTIVPGEDGHYKLVTNAFPDFNIWRPQAFYDHTAGNGTGYMFAVNSAYDKNEFFRRRFTGVVPGATYNFSAWIANLTPSAGVKPNVSFQVLDPATNTILASNVTGNLTGSSTVWTQYTLSFVATTSELELMLINNNVGGSGNDLAIDDISFKMMPPVIPVTKVTQASCDQNGSIEVTAPSGPSYQYSIDGTNYQVSPVFANLTGGNYTVYAKFMGTTGCISSKNEKINVAICGKVSNDTDGNVDGKVDGSGIGSAGATPLYVSLYNGSTLIETISVNPDGTYEFKNVPANATYSIVLGANGVANPTSPFAGTGSGGWYSTGEDCCDNTGHDAAPNGLLTVVVTNTGQSNANLGIQQPPGGITSTAPDQPNPGGSISVPVPGSYFDGNDQNGGTVTSLTITGFPTNTESITIGTVTYYPNAGSVPGVCPTLTCLVFPSTGGVIVPVDVNGNPSVSISLNPVNGSVTSVIPYVAVDNANAVSAQATVSLPFTEPALPVTLVSFNASNI
ncbi:hypothetical protein GVN16_25865, partial [Emticicia sp. CRIBPO]|nr:hypothetical protein [Emticicia sp. CRIBPO]